MLLPWISDQALTLTGEPWLWISHLSSPIETRHYTTSISGGQHPTPLVHATGIVTGILPKDIYGGAGFQT